jgi:hypothetical protein
MRPNCSCPVTHDGVNPDSRYTISPESCGFVVRFNGRQIGESKFYASAAILAIGHNSARKGNNIIVEKSRQAQLTQQMGCGKETI